MEYQFMPAAAQDAGAVFALIRARIRWMDKVGVEQWNKLDYWGAFPESYYRAAIADGRLYVLRRPDGSVAGAGVLSPSDNAWPADGVPALYLHNFVTALDAPGAGDEFLRGCEALARRRGSTCLRLDCAANNRKLNDYYARRGYRAVGRVIEGDFIGTRREKTL
ncbi:MAG: GNAT family N-acetyltransferase [Gemmiger sp.]